MTADGVTPMMVACDARFYEALPYLQRQTGTAHAREDELRELRWAWGHQTKVSCCGNYPAQHAVAVGFSPGIDALA